MNLADKTCVACSGGMEKLRPEQFKLLLPQINNWQIEGNCKLSKTFTYKDFAEPLSMTNKIGALAESEGHHPDLYLSWGKLKVEIWTHKVDGLTESDFVLAAKIDRLK